MSGIPGLFALAQPAPTEGTPAAQLAAARQKLFTADGTDPSALAALWCVGVYDVSVYAHQALAKKGLLSLPARYMLAYSSTPEGLQRCEALYVQVHDVAMATTASGTGTSPPPPPPGLVNLGAVPPPPTHTPVTGRNPEQREQVTKGLQQLLKPVAVHIAKM